MPVPTRSNIFGVPLEELMGYNGEKGGLPRVVKDSISFLRERGLLEEGLFRRSPQTAMLRAAQDAYDRGMTLCQSTTTKLITVPGNVVSLSTFGDPHLAAVLLKKFLRDLPEPIFPESIYPLIRRCPLPSDDPSDMTSITYLRETLLPALPPCSYIVLSQVLRTSSSQPCFLELTIETSVDLMHEVSLRAASNRMDAHNLSVVICPNLVKSSNPIRDVMMCAVPGTPAILKSNAPTGSNFAQPGEGRTTLGVVIQICIQRYYEVFDEVWDRSEALPPSISERSSASASPLHAQDDDAFGTDDEDDIDDAMLVMPIGPSGGGGGKAASPPSAWAAANGAYKPKHPHRSTPSRGSTSSRVRSVHTAFGDGSSSSFGGTAGYAYASMGKAKSMISIENGGGAHGKKGSISIGRGTSRKSSGASVAAIGITAEGFFSPPKATPPPVPPRKFNGARVNGGS
ncbi:hypothetical protein H0H81_004596 [Sphagnurus paluster]|uniref:Rho-GAP domain-containing protein n=1 Tax=Sphagnurus paluster TaxID=117069 RepID=A0A9P7FZ26_9AGAR|nr:hypothetical protein H0H81_004596 [Sphagnurus paluster]